MPQHRFASTTFLVWGTLLIWIGNFVAVYVFTAFACARQFHHVELAGIPVVPLTTTVLTATSAAFTATLMWRAQRRAVQENRADQHSPFIRFLILATGALALIGALWIALPPLLLNGQCEGGA